MDEDLLIGIGISIIPVTVIVVVIILAFKFIPRYLKLLDEFTKFLERKNED